MPPLHLAAVAITTVVVLLTLTASAGGARVQGDAVEIGELVLVRLNVTGSGGVLVGFMMCDDRACSKVETWGIEPTKEPAIRSKDFIDCNNDGWGGTQVGNNVGADYVKVYPATTLLLVTRDSDELLTVKLLNDRSWAPTPTASVALSKTMDRLYVKDHWSLQLSPANMTVEFLTDSSWRRECANGGVLKTDGTCDCAHGFDGPSCETACGPGRYGLRCAQKCPGGGRGCQGMHFKDVQTSDGAKVCGTGLRGRLCDEVCGVGYYGPGCSLLCGECNPEPDRCDPYTGQCPEGCLPGYHGPTCHRALTHLMTGPDIDTATATLSDSSIRGSFAPSAENTAGSGSVAYYEVQYREVNAAGLRAGGWVSRAVVGRLASNWSAEQPAKVYDFVVEGLRPGVEHDVRVVLLDSALRGYERVPHVRVSPVGTRHLSDITVYNVTARKAHISWSNSANVSVLVRYECVEMLACSEDCSQTYSMFSIDEGENRTTAGIEGLLPGTTYRVLVSPKDAPREQAECATFTTPFTVPDAVPEAVVEGDEVADKSRSGGGVAADPGLVSVTNSSATVRWRMPELCFDFNGIVMGTRWQLFLRTADCPGGPAGCVHPFCPLGDCSLSAHLTSGLTTSTTLVFDFLQPSTDYELRLWLYNTEGYNLERYLSMRFTTVREAPAA